MSRPVPNTTLGGYRPNQVKINSIGIGIDDPTLDALNLNSSQFMVVGGQANEVFNMVVDSEGVIINSSIPNRAIYSQSNNEYALFVDGNIYVSGKVDTSAGTLSNIAGGGGGGAFACNYWMPVRRDIPSSTNIFYDGRINVANESQSRSNTYRVNITDNANYTINNAQLAIKNQVGSTARAAILGYSNLSPMVFNTNRVPIEFHAGRTQTYFDSVYYYDGQYRNLPKYTSNTNAPHLVINTDGNVGVKVSPNPPITYSLRTATDQSPPEIIPTTVSNRPADLHVDGTMYSCNVLIYDYESRSIKNVDDLYVRRLGVTFAASQVIPGEFGAGDYTFLSNVSLRGPIEQGIALSVYGKVHVTDQLLADKAFLTSNLVIQDTLQVNGTTYFENDVIANENVQVNQNLVVWGGIYADSNSLYTIVPGGSNQNTTTNISFLSYTADGWSNIYPQGAGFITPGKVGIGISTLYDTTPGQLTVVSRDSNIYGLALYDKTNTQFTKALFVGHQRSNIIRGEQDASVIFATPSSTSPFFSYTNSPYPQNMYFYPGKYDKTIQGMNTVTDDTPPSFSIYETGQVAVNSFKPTPSVQLYVNGSIGFSSNLYVLDSPNSPTKLAQLRYVPVVGISGDTGIRYKDTAAPYVGLHREPDNRYGLAVQGGIQSDTYYTADHRKGVLWMDSSTANADVSATSSSGMYAISKVAIGINQPEYMLDIRGDNADIGNHYGTYVRLSKSTLDESLSNTGIRFDGLSQPWFVNVESVTETITRYHVACSPNVYSLVDTSNAVVGVNWSSNTYSTLVQTSNSVSSPSYVSTVITTSNLTVGSSNILNNSNIYNLYDITYLSNVTSNITSNVGNIPDTPAIAYSVSYQVTTTATTGVLTASAVTSNYNSPLAPVQSNIIVTSNVVNTSNIVRTSNVYFNLNTSNYVYSSNSSGIMIQHDTTKALYGHQMVIGGNASLVDNAVHNPNPNPNAVLTVNGDTSILGSLNVSGYITANNLVQLTATSGRSNVPTIEADDLFISGKDLYMNPTNKLYVNYNSNILRYPIETTNKAVLNVYQDIYTPEAPTPIAHFVGEGDNTFIEIMSKAINQAGAGVNDGILRIGLLSGDTVTGQVIGFQDGAGSSYMTFRKLGSTARAMGINTVNANAQLHVMNNSVSMNQNMLRLTYDNGSIGDTANYTANLMMEKQYSEGAESYKKQWIIEGPTYGTDLYDQLGFKFVKIVTNNLGEDTVTSNSVLTLTSNGCIGINNRSPTYLLDVITSNTTDNLNHGIRLWNKIDQDISQLVFQSGSSPDVGGDDAADYVMYSCNSEFIFRQRKTASSTPLFYFNSNANLGMNTQPNTSYNVNVGGTMNVTDTLYSSNIGIGTSNTYGYNLYVVGNAKFTGLLDIDGAFASSSFIGTLAGIANAALYASNAAYASNLLGTPSVALDALTASNATVYGTLDAVAGSALYASNAAYSSNLLGTPSVALDALTASNATVYGTANMGRGQVGTESTTAGGPFFLQQPWDTTGDTHIITYPSYCVADNSTGMIYIQVSNKSTTPDSDKMGNIQASFIKSYGSNVDVLEITNHKNLNLTTLTITNDTSNIVVTTDSDCYVSWTSIGSC